MQVHRRQFVVGLAASAALAQRGWGQKSLAPKDLREEASVRKHLLSNRLHPDVIAASLVPAENWKPYPKLTSRAGWQSLPEDFRKKIVTNGEKRLKAQWPALPATLFLEFRRNGNRTRYEAEHFRRREHLRDLVLAECVQAQGKFLDDIGNAIWSICEESFWGVPAHTSLQKAGTGLADLREPIIDLFGAETSAMLSWTDYLLGPALDQVSPRIRERIRWEAERRILAPARERNDLHWMGLNPKSNAPMNNHTPWINSNWLSTALLLEPDPAKRTAVVVKSLATLDRFLDVYRDDGGCDEGPEYWSEAAGALFDCLDILYSASNGSINVYDMPLLREMGRYIARVHVAGEFYVNSGDAGPKAHPSAYLVWRYGQRVNDPELESMGGWLRSPGLPVNRNMRRQLEQLFTWRELEAAPSKEPLAADCWMPGLQLMTARCQAGSEDGLFVAAQGGNNGKSHNHNDVGNFIVYSNGRPVIIDVGVENYTAKTFSAQRYDIWTMQSAWHNLPTIDGVMQSPGPGFHASDVRYEANAETASFSADLATAYPAEAGLQSWRRNVTLDKRAKQISITDDYSLSRQPGQITLTLMTAVEPALDQNGALRVGGLAITFDKSLTPKIEPVRITDSRLHNSWGDAVWRVLLVASAPPVKARWTTRIG